LATALVERGVAHARKTLSLARSESYDNGVVYLAYRPQA
jgi:hypothetical protein